MKHKHVICLLNDEHEEICFLLEKHPTFIHIKSKSMIFTQFFVVLNISGSININEHIITELDNDKSKLHKQDSLQGLFLNYKKYDENFNCISMKKYNCTFSSCHKNEFVLRIWNYVYKKEICTNPKMWSTVEA